MQYELTHTASGRQWEFRDIDALLAYLKRCGEMSGLVLRTK